MPNGGETMMDIVLRLDRAERELAAMQLAVRGPLPAPGSSRSLEDRIAAVEQFAASPIAGVPATASYHGTPSQVEQEIVGDIEWGKPSSTPTGDSATITLQPCKEDGTSYADADTAKLYILCDRGSVDLGSRSWTTSTILNFVRFPIDTTADTCVGVLVGLDGGGDSGAGTSVEVDEMYAVDVSAAQTVTVDVRNWLGREIWYTIAYSYFEWGGGAVGSANPPIGDQDPEWGGHLTVRAHHSGYTSTAGGNELELDTVGLGAGSGTARLYIDKADSGKLKVEFDDAGNGCYFRIVARGYPRRPNTDFILVNDP